jgi:uncharacterized lipoprotein YajG
MTAKYANSISLKGLCRALLILTAILLLAGCSGSGNNDSQGTGSISFSVH